MPDTSELGDIMKQSNASYTYSYREQIWILKMQKTRGHYIQIIREKVEWTNNKRKGRMNQS